MSLDPAAPTTTDLTLPAADGLPLAATLYEPPNGGSATGTVLVNSATGVLRGYYGRFAAFLASEGLRALTYDYRGIGGSLPGPLRACRARMQDWGERDAAGALDYLERRFRRRVLVVGHSFGGQALGLMQRNPRIGGALIVAAQSGYWRHWSGRHRAGMFAIWFVLMPSLSRLLGYFPSRAFGFGENLPAGVARQWAAWGRRPGYIRDSGNAAWNACYDGLDTDLLAYSLADDYIAPRRAVEGLLRFFPRARVEHRHVEPADLGVKSIGHFGFFREAFRDSLWRAAADWLNLRAAVARSGPA